MILRKGSIGEQVKMVQGFLGLKQDGEFGPKTDSEVRKWQSDNGLVVDGIVGPATWELMGIASTDVSEMEYYEEIRIKESFLPKGQYKEGPVDKEYLFLHHTAGWDNPYKTIRNWGNDNRGAVATEFVIGGQSVRGENRYDGEIVRCIPNEGYAWHLGKNGSRHMHIHSVGVEVCNFGNLTKGGYKNKGVWIDRDEDKYYTWAGVEVNDEQVVILDNPFRGYDAWHRYSDKQIESLRELILFISKRDGIDICKGLVEELTKKGRDAFEFNEDAYYGRVKGMWTHTNTRTDKFDMFPQPELIEMLLSL